MASNMPSELKVGIKKILSLFYIKVLKYSTVPVHVLANVMMVVITTTTTTTTTISIRGLISSSEFPLVI